MIKVFTLIILLLSISGCSTKEDDSFVQSIFQTNGAAAVRVHTNILRDSLLKYKIKLDKRNPSFHSKNDSKAIEDEIQHNLQRAKNSNTLTDEDKRTLQNNINIMHDYLVQRSINKSVYYCAVNYLADLLKKDNISYIIVPMFQKFAHVLHSVQGVLLKNKAPIDTNLEVYQKEGELLVKLQVINN